MPVKLISYSQPAENFHDETSMKTLEELIVHAARVSNPANQGNKDTAAKLIKYLLKHKHFSPFEMVHICLEIETTRDIARQILRHRSFSFQEFSQRYADPTKELEFIRRGARLQDMKNRQNSIDAAPQSTQDMWDLKQQEVIRLAKETYAWAIGEGIAKEQARSVLPEGLTMSRMYMSGSLRSWIHYLEVRTGGGTQREHMDIALGVAGEISTIFPLIRNLQNEV